MTEKTNALKHRDVASFQDVARLGKSTTMQALMSWSAWAGVPFEAIDADGVQRSVSSWYPDIAERLTYRKEDDLLPILNHPRKAPLRLIDFPSQRTDDILRDFSHYGALNLLRKQGSRLTVLIFASDEKEAMNSAHRIMATCTDEADYVLVRNPARSSSTIFDASKLPGMLRKHGAPTLDIPRISPTTMTILESASRKARKQLTFREAEPMLEIGCQFELEYWRNAVFSQFEDIAEFLLPSVDLIQQRVERPKQKKVTFMDPYDL
jgi:hypothetical protein